tara:strand:+ start:926 stop:1900 length:975 start_codon:yes stop_codon:yes gene_type:complete
MPKNINFNVTDDTLEPFYAVELMFGTVTRQVPVEVHTGGDGNDYSIENTTNYDGLVVGIGSTIVFDQSNATNTGHPLRLSLTSDGTHGGGVEYTTGVTISGVPGQANAKTQWVVDATLSHGDILYYYCSSHSGMGGSITVSTAEQRLWTGFGEITVAGNTYYGTGDLGAVSELSETQMIESRGINLSLSGIPSNLVSDALLQDYQGQVARIYFGTLTNGQIVVQPYLLFSGYMDVMNIIVDGSTSQIDISLENKIADLLRTKVTRLTNEDQLARFPGDTSLRFVDAIQSDKEILWGVPTDIVGRVYKVPTQEEVLDQIKNIRFP